MSFTQVFLEKLNIAIPKVNQVYLAKINNQEDIEPSAESMDNVLCDLFDSMESQLERKFTLIEKFQQSTPGESPELIDQFLATSEEEKEAYLKVMEIVWKMGVIQGDSDVEKRKGWYEALSQAKNNEPNNEIPKKVSPASYKAKIY